MEIDIKCLECGRGTRNFELGDLFCSKDNENINVIIKNSIDCPKCKKDISNEKFLIKRNDLFWKSFTATICLSSSKTKVPQHLKGINFISNEDLEKIVPYCQSKPKVVNKF